MAQIIADHLGNGWSVEEVIRQYPYLQPAEVHAAFGYYFDHRAEIEAELTAELEAIEGETAPASQLRLRLLGRRISQNWAIC